MGLLDIFRRKKSGTASPSTDSKRGDWMKWFLNREGLGGMKFNPDPGGYIDYSPFFQRGGSVNPHEETTRAARDWSPREQYISRSNQDRMHDATVNRFIQEGQSNQQRWEQGGGQGPYPVFNDQRIDYSPPITEGWMEASSGRDNSGIMAADAGSIMNKYKQFTEKFGDLDIGRDGIEYEKKFDVPFGGTGTFKGYGGYGGGDDYGAGINFNWPLGQSAALDEGIGSTDEYQMAELTQDQRDYMRNPYFSPGLPGAPTADELFNQVKEREDKGFFGWGAQEPTTRPEFDEYYNELQGSFYA